MQNGRKLGVSINAMINKRETAWRLLVAAHDAWSAPDLNKLESCFTKDLEYQCNGGTSDGSPLTLVGRDEFIDFWTPLVTEFETLTSPETFHLDGDTARAQISVKVLHFRTGHKLTGTYRQLLTFRSGLICRIEEYHDAAKLAAFWQLVLHDDAGISSSLGSQSN